MRVSRVNNLICFSDTSYDDAPKFKRARLAWDRKGAQWVTPFASYAAKAFNSLGIVDSFTSREIVYALRGAELDAKGSSAFASTNIHHLALFPYQNAGVDYITSRPATLIADEPGLGKTAQAIVSCDVWGAKTILVVCPASLKINWLREFSKFSTRPRAGWAIAGSTFPLSADVVIINYDILRKHHQAIRSRVWDVVIADEVHFVKECTSIRSKELVGAREIAPIQCRRKLALTGTPVVNRPIELFNIMRFLCPYAFPNKFDYASRYCDMKKDPWGWDMTGASNLDELQSILRGSFMLRREKKDVLTQLPPKTRQVIELDPDTNMKRVLKKEQEIFGFLGCRPELADEEYEDIIKKLRNPKAGFEEVATIRRENGLAKVNMVIEHIKEVLDEGEKVVVFAHHREVIERLQAAFGDICAVLYGSTSGNARQSAVDRFQNERDVRVFIGNIGAAGVGITLTKSRRVVFAEFDWVPGNNTQAEDRCHRIGQEENLLIQYLVIDGSIDAAIAKTFVKKQEVIERATNKTEEQKLQELLA